MFLMISLKHSFRKQAAEFVADHVVTSRVNAETLDDIYEYFRPFERKDKQKVVRIKFLKNILLVQVVNRHALAALQDHVQGNSDERRILDEAKVRTIELILKTERN